MTSGPPRDSEPKESDFLVAEAPRPLPDKNRASEVYPRVLDPKEFVFSVAEDPRPLPDKEGVTNTRPPYPSFTTTPLHCVIRTDNQPLPDRSIDNTGTVRGNPGRLKHPHFLPPRDNLLCGPPRTRNTSQYSVFISWVAFRLLCSEFTPTVSGGLPNTHRPPNPAHVALFWDRLKYDPSPLGTPSRASLHPCAARSPLSSHYWGGITRIYLKLTSIMSGGPPGTSLPTGNIRGGLFSHR
ncbi:hypothetical protein B0H16DRAFT_1484483 [Mycena metata]|uniref:Uncharacterized protein n=1 Tax=Mycena metata TaxID=1033252 RepID=A0AAD7DT59_9AGAR|nr:hypothetical protein B0H16DRAFT_1484483 [Mycena metata]